MAKNKPVIEVEESTEYESCIDFKDETYTSSTLSGFLGIEDEDVTKEWEKHWKGMPEYKQENNPPYMKIFMSFRNEEDYKAFAELVDQNLTEKTKSIWYPKLDRDENTLKRWMETDD